MEDWNKLTVPQLKTACTERSLDVSGKKADLVQRLEAYVEENKEEVKEEVGNGDAEEGTEQMEEAQEATEESEQQADNGTDENVKEEEEEKDVEDVIEAIDDIIEEEKKEGEEGEGDKKEGEEKKETKEEDKTEKKKETQHKTFVKVPIKRNVRQEVFRERRYRTVVIGYIETEDLKNEKLIELIQKGTSYTVTFPKIDEPGYVHLRMKDFDAAKELVENTNAEEIKEGLVLKQTKQGIDEHVQIESLLKGEGDKKTEAFELRTLYLHNVPESATEDALKELVPEAISAIIPRDDERKFKGYAFLEFEEIKKMEEYIKKTDHLMLEEKKMTLHNLPNFLPDDRRNQGGRFGGNFRQQGNFGNKRFDNNQRGGFQQRGGRGGNYGNRNQYGDRWGNQGGRNYGNQGPGGAQAVDLLMGISQMLRTQQGGGGAGGGGYDQRGYGQQRGYDNYGPREGGYQQDWGRKRRFEDGGYNQGGGYGSNKRFNTGRRY